MSQNGFVQLAKTVELIKLLAVTAEITQPVSTLTVPVDWIGKLLLDPQSIGQQLAVDLADHFGNDSADSGRIAGVFVGIKDDQRFVNVVWQNRSPYGFFWVLAACCGQGCVFVYGRQRAADTIYSLLSVFAL